VLIDAGNAKATGAENLLATDRDGTPRVLNGRIDIGCYEADWRPKYSTDLGRYVEVTNASPAVYEADGGVVRIPDGRLDATFKEANAYKTELLLVGGGILVVTAGRREVGRFTEAGSHPLFFEAAAGDALAIAFVPDGETADSHAEVRRIGRDIGTLLIIR